MKALHVTVLVNVAVLVPVKNPYISTPMFETPNLLVLLIENNISPSVSGLSNLTTSLVDTVLCVISKLPNKFTLPSSICNSGVVPTVPTLSIILLSVSPFHINKS